MNAARQKGDAVMAKTQTASTLIRVDEEVDERLRKMVKTFGSRNAAIRWMLGMNPPRLPGTREEVKNERYQKK